MGWCQPCSCEGKECGENGCGLSCGSCSGTDRCLNGACVPCEPACNGMCNVDNGCGQTCSCELPMMCFFNMCVSP